MSALDLAGKEIEVGQMVKVIERPNPLLGGKGPPLLAYKGVVSEIVMGDDFDWVVKLWELETWSGRAARTEHIRIQRTVDEVRAIQSDVIDGEPTRTATHRHFLLYAMNGHLMQPRAGRGLASPPKEAKEKK